MILTFNIWNCCFQNWSQPSNIITTNNSLAKTLLNKTKLTFCREHTKSIFPISSISKSSAPRRPLNETMLSLSWLLLLFIPFYLFILMKFFLFFYRFNIMHTSPIPPSQQLCQNREYVSTNFKFFFENRKTLDISPQA